MAKRYNKANVIHMQKTVSFLLESIQRKKDFLLLYSVVYKMPKRAVKRNLRFYNKVIKGCNSLLESDFTNIF